MDGGGLLGCIIVVLVACVFPTATAIVSDGTASLQSGKPSNVLDGKADCWHHESVVNAGVAGVISKHVCI